LDTESPAKRKRVYSSRQKPETLNQKPLLALVTDHEAILKERCLVAERTLFFVNY
jgi:hypothetical protein